MHRHHPELTALDEREIGEVGLANAGCVRQNRSEDPVQLARRARNDLQHLGGRRLLLQRLGELLFQVGVGCANAVNVSSRLRCLRTKTGSASSTLRPFASQDHLVGTATGPPSGRPKSSLSILTELHDELAPFNSITSSAASAEREVMEYSAAHRRSPGLCAGKLDYFAPLLGIVSDELAEVRDRAGKYHAPKVGKPRLQLGISEPRIDLAIELINDLGRRVFGRTEANPLARLETRHEIANGRDIRECL